MWCFMRLQGRNSQWMLQMHNREIRCAGMMKRFFNTLKCDLKRSVASYPFGLAVIGYVVVTLLTMFDELPFFQIGSTSLVYIFYIFRYLDFHSVYLIFAAIPSTLLFCSDWDNQYIRFAVLRSMKRTYAASKGIACFLSAFMVIVLSNSLLLVLFGIRFPVWCESSGISLGGYATLDAPDRIYVFFLIKILCEAFCAGFLCVFALWLSTKIINAFVVLAAPLLSYYIFNTVGAYFGLPVFLNLSILSKGDLCIGDDPKLSFFTTAAILLGLSVMFGISFVKNCIRRIEHG